MKIFICRYDEQAIGGGWSFCYNLKKALGDVITSDYNEADIYFIPSASMIDRDSVQKARDDGKRIVLRCDNVIRNSRNRNSGMTRMKDFSDWADMAIFQSKFAMELLQPYLTTENYRIIHNSVDESIFNTSGHKPNERPVFLYASHSSDETKNWEMARSAYQVIHNDSPSSILNIVGRRDLAEANFDFYNGEQYKYWGLITDKNTMAEIYRQSDYMLYTYFQDACSNTVIEALLCGVEILDCYHMGLTGGTPEIMRKFITNGPQYFHLERMAREYMEAFSVALS